jgi:putative NIF3 family GTP cyclohydrolase 1 type 2
MKYLIILFILNLSFPFVQLGQTNKTKITANEVVNQIKQHVTCPWMERTVDTFKAGNPEDEVTGIAVCMFADMKILKEAVANHCNMIITHEPIFYNGQDETANLQKSDVYKEKLKYLNDHKLIVFRFHDHIHRTKPDGICAGMVDKLGWKSNMVDSTYLYFQFKEQTLSEFVNKISSILKTKEFRVVGDKDLKFTKVSMSVGASGSLAHLRQLQDERTEVLVAGEAQEWETYQYVNDAVLLGKKMAAIFLGHIPSEEAGMEYCADWLGRFIKDVPIIFIQDDPVYWSPK